METWWQRSTRSCCSHTVQNTCSADMETLSKAQQTWDDSRGWQWVGKNGSHLLISSSSLPAPCLLQAFFVCWLPHFLIPPTPPPHSPSVSLPLFNISSCCIVAKVPIHLVPVLTAKLVLLIISVNNLGNWILTVANDADSHRKTLVPVVLRLSQC